MMLSSFGFVKKLIKWGDFSHEEEGQMICGPRLIVRSIKKIKKGEEVTVAYTDLLQPKVCIKLMLLVLGFHA